MLRRLIHEYVSLQITLEVQFPSERTSCVPISYVVSSRKRDETGTTGMRMASLPRHTRSLGGSRESLVHWRLSSSSALRCPAPPKTFDRVGGGGRVAWRFLLRMHARNSRRYSHSPHSPFTYRSVPSRGGEGTGGTRSSVRPSLTLSLSRSFGPSVSVSLSPRKPRKDRRRGSNKRARESCVARARVFFSFFFSFKHT